MAAPETVGNQTATAEESAAPQLTPEQAQLFAEEFERSRSSLMNHAVRLTTDTARAEDLVQEAFFKAMRKAGDYKEEGHMRAWLHVILENTFFTETRREKLARKHGYDPSADLQDEEGIRPYWGQPQTGPETIVLSKVAVEGLLGSIVHTLGKGGTRKDLIRTRLATLLLMEDEGYRRADVADMFDMNQSTVASGKHKFERELRPILERLLQTA